MKTITMILGLLCATPALSESFQVDITPENTVHAGVRFAVVSAPEKLMQNQFQVARVIVAVTPASTSTASSAGYIEVWDDNQFVFSSILKPCMPSDIPKTLKAQIKTKDAILFSFKINPLYLRNTWFNYQASGSSTDDEPIDYVIHLRNFVKPSKPSDRTSEGRKQF